MAAAAPTRSRRSNSRCPSGRSLQTPDAGRPRERAARADLARHLQEKQSLGPGERGSGAHHRGSCREGRALGQGKQQQGSDTAQARRTCPEDNSRTSAGTNAKRGSQRPDQSRQLQAPSYSYTREPCLTSGKT